MLLSLLRTHSSDSLKVMVEAGDAHAKLRARLSIQDILVHLVGRVSKLLSQLRGLSWSEVERVAAGEKL